MADILPSSASGYDTQVGELETADGFVRTVTESGPVAVIKARRDSYRLVAGNFNSNIAGLDYKEVNGRATLTVNYDTTEAWNSLSVESPSLQELQAVDLVRDIKCAQYFATLTNDQVADVQAAWDARLPTSASWIYGQKALYGHMSHGQENYIETTYEFRQTRRINSSKMLRISMANPNTVQELPDLNSAMSRLVESLPEGEWLKKPTVILNAGKHGWTVTEIYQWAKQWSVIYGGTFTGL
jgi:hypothetical protein